jgi:hypothetical protein
VGYFGSDNTLVEAWAERWYRLIDLLFETIRTDKPTTVLLQSVVFEENLYQSLRSWFIKNNARFLPLLKRYFQSQD